MSYRGQAAIDYLASQIQLEDPGESSHWRHFHRDFALRADGAFTGLQGFGGCARPYRGVRALVHHALQWKYRRVGRRYPEFECLDAVASSIVERQGRACDLDVLRQTITLAFLKRHLPWLGKDSIVAVIGDGFASMTTLLLAAGLAKQVYLVNLNKTLLVDLAYFARWAGQRSSLATGLAVDPDDVAQACASPDQAVVAIQASNHALLARAPIDVAINIASMQEMDPPVIADYFANLRTAAARKSLHFYCCNRVEKSLPDSTIVRFSAYPWNEADEILIDELCPWHQQYYSARAPFYHPYDGPIWHRLARLAPTGSGARPQKDIT